MLLFNHLRRCGFCSFCCISKHLMLLFNRTRSTVICFGTLFQNISCYCLTAEDPDYYATLLKFQNISCYCLTISHCRQRLGLNTISKHLMLLFNKHTTINLIIANNISKHLMLLFNQRKIVIFK